MRNLMRLVRQMQPELDDSSWRLGVVSAVAADSCSVKMGGNPIATTGVHWLSSYYPVVGRTVVVIRNGPDLLIVGEVGSTGTETAWTTFTPTITSTGTAPTMGAANRTGRYKVIGKTCIVQERFAWTALGAGEGTGSGSYRFSLPVAAADVTHLTGAAYVLDNGTANIVGATDGVSTTTVRIATNTGEAGSTAPMTPANGDRYHFAISYEIA